MHTSSSIELNASVCAENKFTPCMHCTRVLCVYSVHHVLDRYNVCHGVCVCMCSRMSHTMYIHRVCPHWIGPLYIHLQPMCSQRRIYRETSHMGTHEENTVTFTQCVHVHKSVRVTVRSCSHILL